MHFVVSILTTPFLDVSIINVITLFQGGVAIGWYGSFPMFTEIMRAAFRGKSITEWYHGRSLVKGD